MRWYSMGKENLKASSGGCCTPNHGVGFGVAVLFDAENISPRCAGEIIKQSQCYGRKPIIRAYADFSRVHTKGWEEPAVCYGIRTIHQFSQTSGNSSSDFLMMYDAFKLLHGGKVSTFVVVTNDHDFLTPIQLLRQSGGFVHGFAEEEKVKNEFVRSCNTFSFIPMAPRKKQQQNNKGNSGDYLPDFVKEVLIDTCKELNPSNEWVSLSRLGQEVCTPLRKAGYRFRNLSSLLQGCDGLETDYNRGHQYVRVVKAHS